MQLSSQPQTHLTYCTNIHPGERWEDVRAHIEGPVSEVKARLCPDQRFGVGLRLSARAAETLTQGDELQALRRALRERGLYVFSINGFPYGAFHGARVKENVYAPDWRSPRRLAYTDTLARALAALLPDGIDGSISTVPGGFKPAIGLREVATIRRHLIRHVSTLMRIHRETGKVITLALEPEPYCMLETIEETVDLFRNHLFSGQAVRALARHSGSHASQAEQALHRHLGVCLDTCHAAVEFEDPASAVGRLRDAGIGIAKLQLSAGLRIDDMHAGRVSELKPFADEVYLHQVVEKRSEGLRRYVDLPEALEALQSNGEVARQWRVHFHVPIFHEELRCFGSTQRFLREILAMQRRQPIASHLEVETYTWDVLPEEARGGDVVDDICSELRWVLDELRDTRKPASRA